VNREVIRRLLRPFARAVRGVTVRLSGFGELRLQLDRQDAVMRGLEEAILDLRARQDELMRSLPGRELLDVIAKEHTALRTAATAALKTAEKTVTDVLVDEVNRLDGYVLFHANELRAEIADLARRVGSDPGTATPVTPFAPPLADAA